MGAKKLIMAQSIFKSFARIKDQNPVVYTIIQQNLHDKEIGVKLKLKVLLERENLPTFNERN